MPTSSTTQGAPVSVTYAGEQLDFRYSGRLTPAANRKLTDAQYRVACELADRIGRLRSGTGDATRATGTGADLSGGANAWAGDLAGGWHPLFEKDRRHFDHLRLFCQPFTGYDPIGNRMGGPVPSAIPEDIDERLRAQVETGVAVLELLSDQRRLPDYARVTMPAMFGETGAICDGTPMNYDAWCLQLQMNGLYGSGILDRLRERAGRGEPSTVVDIGSGFGGLAYQLGRVCPLRLVAVDLPDSLLFAAVYLSILWEDRPTYLALPEGYLSTATWEVTERLPDAFAAVFVTAGLADRVLRDLQPLDLVLNFRSMQEMSDAQVAGYGRLAQAVLGDHGLLYEQNDRVRAVDRDVKAILGGILPFGGVIEETAPPHRGMGPASLWSNRPLDLRPPA